MLVLGISNNDVSGACLVNADTIISAVSEERLTRIKNHKTWPSRSISYVLNEARVSLDDIDFVAYGWSAGFNPEKHLNLYVERIFKESHPASVDIIKTRMINEVNNNKEKSHEFKEFVAKNNLQSKAVYIDHHECHALGAFICSPFEEALTVTCDGRGDFQSLTVSRYSESGVDVLQRETTIDSLGFFYGRITHLLGFKANRHEGKVTGLASHGNKYKLLPLMTKMISLGDDGRVMSSCGDLYNPSYSGYSDALTELLKDENPEDIAAAAQYHIENIVCGIVSKHIKNGENVCLAGGVFGNVKLNQRIREIQGVKNVYVLPCMGDEGLPLAAAVAVSFQKNGYRFKNPSMKLGPEVPESTRCMDILREQYPQLSFDIPENPIDLVGELFRKGKVVGLVKGKMEFGPRALCNRSIIYPASDKGVNEWLNKRMSRTEFMPFAPITAFELAADCYIGWKKEHYSSEFMTMTYECHDFLSYTCPAVVHVDNTSRPQIVKKEDDPFVHELLVNWHSKTNQPALINTSFNKHEEPIVESIDDAISALQENIVDVIIFNDELFVWR
ncbi:carbamoyltransferase C-terminal domain-containing protein [Dongshaea marina]|uniref:carbamoyltransferase C-terminal domain-containing protein n=1 Tax=Dongshaea marina TaxID=2047966 RepID=UPI000D3EAC85|nr:carbamoyltransferase C-terminal domain-containing protein [Dongshaea marina]